jgi:hypothetical protein
MHARRLLAVGGLAGIALVAGVAAGSSGRPADPRAPRVAVQAAEPVRCDRTAAPSGADRAEGTRSQPFASAARLVRSLRAGETGCLRAGTYRIAPELTFRRAGTANAPITLRSWPGERAKLVGGTVVVRPEAEHVVLSALRIDGSNHPDVTVWVLANDTTIVDNDITNRTTGLSCVFIGSGSWREPPTLRTQIRRNRITDCGSDAHNDHDHGIYAAQSQDAVVADNLLTGSDGWGVQLYPHAVGARVLRNTIARNGGGVIFAGNHSVASSGNIVERNVLSDPRDAMLVQSYWEGPSGTGNVARRNCFGRAAHGQSTGSGFSMDQNLVAAPAYRAPGAGDYALGAQTGCSAVIGSPPDPGAPASVTGGPR